MIAITIPGIVITDRHHPGMTDRHPQESLIDIAGNE
jgi:hypothetical protein